MADEITQFKQLQAQMNAAFDSLIQSSQDGSNNAGAIAAAKQQIAALSQVTLGTVLGPVFSIIGLTLQVSSSTQATRKEKLTSSPAASVYGGANCDRSKCLRNC